MVEHSKLVAALKLVGLPVRRSSSVPVTFALYGTLKAGSSIVSMVGCFVASIVV